MLYTKYVRVPIVKNNRKLKISRKYNYKKRQPLLDVGVSYNY